MANFEYTARNQNGTIIRGQIDGETARAAKGKIIAMGHFPISIQMQGAPKLTEAGVAAKKAGKRIKQDDLVAFTWQLSAMLNSGLPIVEALSALEEETENPTLKNALGAIRKDIQDGESFSTAISRYPKIFPGLYVSLVRAGEIGGMLDAVLERLSVYLDKEHELRQRLRAAFTYPIVVACLAVVAVTILMLAVVPTFARIYKANHIDLPGPTRLLIFTSNLVSNYWWAILALAAIGYVVYLRIKEIPSYREFIDERKIKFPIFGKLTRKVAISRFMRTLSNMVKSGVPMMDALELSSNVAGNIVITKAVAVIRKGVSEGEGIAVPMRRCKEFPPLVIHMVSAGEGSGSLDTMLEKIANFYDREVDFTVKRITTIIEPLLTVAMGVVVGFIAVAMYLPIFSIAKVIHR